MQRGTLRSAYLEVLDPLAAVDTYFEQGWTDGLPVVPPTEERIWAMLDAMGKQPSDILGALPVRARVITAEKLAINAVMAGCLSIYAPVLLAMIEALCDPAFSAHGPTASTSGMGILTIVNGPIASQIGLNAGENLFGPGWRANATIGRALRLVLRNVCGALPGILDRSCFGHPGKFTYCIAEDEAHSPWTPLHAERGIPPDEGAVTLFAGEGPHQVANHAAADPEAVLRTIADVMVAAGRLSLSGHRTAVRPHRGGRAPAAIGRSGLDQARCPRMALRARGPDRGGSGPCGPPPRPGDPGPGGPPASGRSRSRGHPGGGRRGRCGRLFRAHPRLVRAAPLPGGHEDDSALPDVPGGRVAFAAQWSLNIDDRSFQEDIR